LRNTTGQTTRSRLKTAVIPENKNYDHFTPISGQGSAPEKEGGAMDTRRELNDKDLSKKLYRVMYEAEGRDTKFLLLSPLASSLSLL
jgi:hypothetical protein